MNKVIFGTKCLVFIKFYLSFIILLEILKIISFVFYLKYLRQNLVNFNFQGVFWNPQDEQNSKLSLDLHFDKDKKVKKGFKVVRSYPCEHCMSDMGADWGKSTWKDTKQDQHNIHTLTFLTNKSKQNWKYKNPNLQYQTIPKNSSSLFIQ